MDCEHEYVGLRAALVVVFPPGALQRRGLSSLSLLQSTAFETEAQPASALYSVACHFPLLVACRSCSRKRDAGGVCAVS